MLVRMRALGTGATIALLARELVRAWRQPTRAIGMIGTALLIWALLGSGFASSFRMPGLGDGAADGVSYARYVFPGMVFIVVVFGTVFTAISLIQDRQEGFLQSVLVSPAPRWSIVASKVGAGVITALVEGGLLLAVGMLSGVVQTSPLGAIGAMVVIALAAAGVTSMGLALAWWVNSVAGFHGLMNLVLLPMWLLSGALFPVEGAHGWLGLIMRLNPMEWATRAMGGALGVMDAGVMEWVGTLAFAGVFASLAVWVVSRK
jgi:ABC-2 type transport system permease protein